jgi:hypothetical protein
MRRKFFIIKKLPDNRTAYFGLADLIRNTSAVTAACKKSI